jgi:hypothetical protein
MIMKHNDDQTQESDEVNSRNGYKSGCDAYNGTFRVSYLKS